MQTPALTTELDAVNTMLGLLGEAPVSSLVAPYTLDVANARNILREQNKKVQAEGWKFNQECDVTLSRNSDNEIILAGNVISVDADTDPTVDIVQREGKLYDAKNHTYTFDHNLQVEIVYMFSFDTLPECVRQYIAIKAARVFQRRFVGSETQNGFTQEEEIAARVTALHEEGVVADVNILNDPHIAWTTRRYAPTRRGR